MHCLALSVVALLALTPTPNDSWAVSTQMLMDPTLICKKTRRLKGKVAEICRNEPALLKEISRGIQLGTRECQFQFRDRRWNCTTARRSIRKVLLRDSRESSFVTAIMSAGMTFSVTRACTMGDLIECSCDKSKKGAGQGTVISSRSASTEVSNGVSMETDWEWGGCGDNVNYGYRKSRAFLDAPYRKRTDIKSLVKLHNNDAGRLVSQAFVNSKNHSNLSVIVCSLILIKILFVASLCKYHYPKDEHY
ncbi:protein Wnt-6 isoform X1 [Nilaparvata lugens]|uniref:protein Wnt-6 isoform X1 n=1 Tax=Nilaparvata lugens TaxID=108931 RepID=UPI00193CDB5C|nr:protein Wnt-6 isoform X1 [Nilaparvata lugens]UTS77841.1 Wnt6 [Nilaparvata lugens]